MKTKLLILLISSLLLASCGSNVPIEQINNGTQDVPSNSLIQEDDSRKANVSPDTSNEAIETPEIDTATGETATSTDFISTGTNVQTGN